jgi:hypothetical protein
MDNHTGYARGKLSRCRGQAFCCHHSQGKGGVFLPYARHSLTMPDCLRPPPGAARTASRAPSLHHAQSGDIPRWTQAHPFAAMRVSGESGHTDDRVEGCPQRRCQRSRVRSSNATLRPGLPPRSPRRSYAWTQDRSHSTSERATSRHQHTAFIPRGVDI